MSQNDLGAPCCVVSSQKNNLRTKDDIWTVVLSESPWTANRRSPVYQGCNSRGVFSKLSNFPLSTMWKWTSTDLEVLVHFHIVERGKLESSESLENIPNFSNFFRGLKRP